MIDLSGKHFAVISGSAKDLFGLIDAFAGDDFNEFFADPIATNRRMKSIRLKGDVFDRALKVGDQGEVGGIGDQSCCLPSSKLAKNLVFLKGRIL